ncbi:MAG: choice-of-anchor Q domain-containing protein, partial [Candidatus Sumerlaeia bacterium]|nr:choice-of-anchor Q domain-containing protein [Candidatus Sumerlaeia bacterium]
RVEGLPMNYIARLAASFALLAGGLPAAELLVPSQYASIQMAVDSAGDGDIITISPGTYVENIKVKGSNLTFRSIEPANPTIRNSTIIRLPTNDSVFDFTKFPVSGESRFEGLYLRGLSSDFGGTIKGIPEVSIFVDGCVFFFCGALLEGGAIYNTKGTIKNSLFDQCTAGVARATDSFTLGAAIARFDGLIENCDFRENVSSGIPASNNSSVAGSGGAIGNSSGIIRNSRFSRNRATNRGGAISGFQGLIEDCFFEQNSATFSGGALSAIESGSIINQCVFVKNSAISVGAIRDSQAHTINSVFISNRASTGTAGVSSNTSGWYVNCIFYDNFAKIGGSTLQGSYGRIQNCIFWGNNSGDGTLFDFLAYDPEFCLIQGWEPDDRGNINAPPSFIDPTLDANNRPRDFRLRPDSPAIDRGLRVFDSGTSVSQALQFDADGNPRPVVNYPTDIFNRGDGFGTDIGAYEHQTVYEEIPRTELWLLR